MTPLTLDVTALLTGGSGGNLWSKGHSTYLFVDALNFKIYFGSLEISQINTEQRNIITLVHPKLIPCLSQTHTAVVYGDMILGGL